MIEEKQLILEYINHILDREYVLCEVNGTGFGSLTDLMNEFLEERSKR